MRVYLAGPMTGLPAHNAPAFDAAERQLCDAGLDVVSPAAMLRLFPDDTLRQHFSRDCQAICDADCVVLLDGWERSKGVAVELALAGYLGIPVLEIDAIVHKNKLNIHVNVTKETSLISQSPRMLEVPHEQEE